MTGLVKEANHVLFGMFIGRQQNPMRLYIDTGLWQAGRLDSYVKRYFYKHVIVCVYELLYWSPSRVWAIRTELSCVQLYLLVILFKGLPKSEACWNGRNYIGVQHG